MHLVNNRNDTSGWIINYKMIVKDFDVCFLPLISSHQLFANFYKKLAGSHIWGKKLIVVILIFKNLFSCWSSLSPSSQLDIVVAVCLHLFYLLSPHPCIVLVELNCYLLYIVLLRIFLTAILTGGIPYRTALATACSIMQL